MLDTISRAARAAVVALAIPTSLLALVPRALEAQIIPGPASRMPRAERLELSGPRFGVTAIGQQLIDTLATHDVHVGPVISQFGWQFEHQFYATADGPAAVTEWVVLVGGLDQGVFLPSLSWIVGMRTIGGAEIGVGPNVSAAGSALVIAAGMTHRVGAMNIPLNVAIVPSKLGPRVSVLAGFTLR